MSAEIIVEVEGKPAQRLPAGATVREALGADADGAIAALVDGATLDLSRTLERDCRLRPVFPDDPEGLDVLRHSSAHLLAQAVKRLYPQAQVTIGPVIEDGFYYDFKYDPGFTPEDLEKITQEMQRIVAANLPVSREELPRDVAAGVF